MIVYTYSEEYGGSQYSGLSTLQEHAFVSRFHTDPEMYARAKYDDVKELKKMAETKVAAALEKPITNAYAVLFLGAVPIVYNRTPDTDRELRHLVIAHAQKHSKLISAHPTFKAAILESGAFVTEFFSKPPTPPAQPYIGKCTRY